MKVIPGPGLPTVCFLVLHGMRSLCHKLGHGLHRTLPAMVVRNYETKSFFLKFLSDVVNDEIKDTNVENWPEKGTFFIL